MKYHKFLALKALIKTNKLGGITDQNIMVPAERKTTLKNNLKTKKAAVLVMFYPNSSGETCLVLTLRPNYSGTHSAQVSFPGGKHEKDDTDLKETALRETFEEIGIVPTTIEIIRKMTDVYIPPSNFLVTPYIGITENTPHFKRNYEVEKIIEVPLKNIIDDSFVFLNTNPPQYSIKKQVPYFNFDNQMVWGATAMIISEIKELLKRLI